MLYYLDVELPAPPVPPHWIRNVTDASHMAIELRHWAVLLDLFSQRPLRPESLVRRHHKRPATSVFQSK